MPPLRRLMRPQNSSASTPMQVPRQIQPGQPVHLELTLIREIVNREHARRTGQRRVRRVAGLQIDGCKRRLPVVRVDDRGRRGRAGGILERGPHQEREAPAGCPGSLRCPRRTARPDRTMPGRRPGSRAHRREAPRRARHRGSDRRPSARTRRRDVRRRRRDTAAAPRSRPIRDAPGPAAARRARPRGRRFSKTAAPPIR